MNLPLPSKDARCIAGSLEEQAPPRMQEVATHLLAVPFPAEFTPGAHAAVTTCLHIAPEEKVTLITDRVTEPIAASLAHELVANGCGWNAFVLGALDPPPPRARTGRERLRVEPLRPRRPRPAPTYRHPRRSARRHGNIRRQHLCC